MEGYFGFYHMNLVVLTYEPLRFKRGEIVQSFRFIISSSSLSKVSYPHREEIDDFFNQVSKALR